MLQFPCEKGVEGKTWSQSNILHHVTPMFLAKQICNMSCVKRGLEAFEVSSIINILRQVLGEKGFSGDAMFVRDQPSRLVFCDTSLVKRVSRAKPCRSQTYGIMLLLCFWQN